MAQLTGYLTGLLIIAASALAQQPPTFSVGMEDSQYFPHFAVQNGQWVGFGPALLDAFSEAHGYRFTYHAMPVERLYRSFLSGEVDFKYPDDPAWRAELKQHKDVVYSDPVVHYTDGVSVLPERQGRSVDSIRFLGTMRGYTPVSWQQYVDQQHTTLLENDSFDGLIRQALLGRIDGIYANIDVVQFKARELTGKKTALVFDPALPHSEAHYRLSTIEKGRIMTEFNMWLVENESLIKKIKAHYFGDTRQ